MSGKSFELELIRFVDEGGQPVWIRVVESAAVHARIDFQVIGQEPIDTPSLLVPALDLPLVLDEGRQLELSRLRLLPIKEAAQDRDLTLDTGFAQLGRFGQTGNSKPAATSL